MIFRILNRKLLIKRVLVPSSYTASNKYDLWCTIKYGRTAGLVLTKMLSPVALIMTEDVLTILGLRDNKEQSKYSACGMWLKDTGSKV